MLSKLKFASTLLLSIAITASLCTTAFALDSQTPEGYYDKFKEQGLSLNVYNWGEYMSDGADDTLGINKEFEERTGIKVYYSTYATNEELYSKLRSGGSKYDIIIPSDYMIARMISENMLETLDYSAIPNYKLINPDLKNSVYDPKDQFSVPYTWGYVGIIYNKTMVFDEVDSWNVLWDERYLGSILMFSNPRDAFAIAQAKLGYSLNTTNTRELEDSLEALRLQKPLVQAYVMDEIFDKMLGGEAALAPYYAGDAVTMLEQNEDLAFAVPKETTNIFVDGVCIPKGSKNKELAQMYINFLCEPEISAANAEYIGYATPNLAALELLDEEITGNVIAYPPVEILQNTEAFSELPRETSLLIDQLWTQLLSTSEEFSRLLVPVLVAGGILLSIGINILRIFKRKNQKNYF